MEQQAEETSNVFVPNPLFQNVESTLLLIYQELEQELKEFRDISIHKQCLIKES